MQYFTMQQATRISNKIFFYDFLKKMLKSFGSLNIFSIFAL